MLNGIDKLKTGIKDCRKNLQPEAEPRAGVYSVLILLVDYIEFMITPEEDDE